MGEIFNGSEKNEIQQIFEDAISKISENDQLTLSDLYVMVNPDEMRVSVYTDDEQLIADGNIDSWAVFKDNPDIFENHMVMSLKAVLNQKEILDPLEKLDLIHPFSVILVDDNFEQQQEIVTIDDNILVLEDDFIKNIDKELDSFLDNLLKDL